ncbi:class F sortase [Streptomyces sp. NPDC005820]|uniref:class F sortase n=1 Tax=Streptomyces sp. NPDC005820 TaxID=3157069 RepID=UPI0033E640CC
MAVPPPSPAPAPAPAADDEPGGQESRSTLTVLCAVALLILAVSLIGGNDASSSGSPSIPPQARQAPQDPGSALSSAPPLRSSAPAAGAAQPVGRRLPRSRPVRLRIPRISVDAPFTDLSLNAKGQLEAPPPNDTNLVGWHAAGPSPGEAGTAIIAGHVDTKISAAVFAGLQYLKKGDVFDVVRADRSVAHFEVDGTETFAKDDFPSERVYADTPRAEARLITCAGTYDRSAKDYKDNLVVFAHLR